MGKPTDPPRDPRRPRTTRPARPSARSGASPRTTRPRFAVQGLPTIVFEDEDLVVVDKPAGLITSSTPRERRPTLLRWLRDYFATTSRRVRLGVIHRLDREASGLLVFSKNDLAYRSLKHQLKQRTIERVYLAMVSGKPNPSSGTIRGDLFELPDGRMVRSRIPGKGMPAITHFDTVRSSGDTALLRVTLETGRKHQVRAHLSQRGNPIIGDESYGGTPSDRGMHLRAVRLAFDHPRTGRRMEFQVDCWFADESIRPASP